MSLQATNESLAAENAQLQLENERLKNDLREFMAIANTEANYANECKAKAERIRQETIEECAKVCDEVRRAGRVHGAQDCAAAIRLQGAGQPQHLPVQAGEQDDIAKLQKRIDKLEADELDALRDRDCYHEWADDLSNAIAKFTGVDIGEHSNMNNPWKEALEAIENYEASAATPCPPSSAAHGADERIKLLTEVRDHFIFTDDDGLLCVSDEIDSDLFDRICECINSAALPSAAPIEREAEKDLERIYDLFGIGAQARSIGVLLTCIFNTMDFAEKLKAVEREFFMVPGEPDDDYPDEKPEDVCLLNRWGSTTPQYVEQFRAALSRESSAAMGELPPLPPYDYYVTLGNGDDYGCWSSSTMREYAKQALAAAQPNALIPEWISVEDRMPESGKTVLAYYINRAGNGRRIRAKWIAADTVESNSDSDIGVYNEEKDTFYDPEGWYEQIDNWDEYSAVAVCEGEISHWQELPAAPIAAAPMLNTQEKKP